MTIDLIEKPIERSRCFDFGDRNIIKQSIISCRLCGEQINKKDELSHVFQFCPKKSVSCRNTGCSEVLLLEDLENHESFCPKKVYCCGYGSSCQLPLSDWFSHSLTCNTKLEKPHLVVKRCEIHESNMFLQAIMDRNQKIVTHLLDNSSLRGKEELLTLESSFGDTALTKASQLGFIELVKLFLWTAISCGSKKIDLVTYINYETKRGKTALGEAIRNNHLDVVQILLENYASVSRKSTVHNRSVLNWAFDLSNTKKDGTTSDKILIKLLEAKKTEYKMCQLFQYIKRGDLEALRAIIGKGERFQYNHISSLRKKLSACKIKLRRYDESIVSELPQLLDDLNSNHAKKLYLNEHYTLMFRMKEELSSTQKRIEGIEGEVTKSLNNTFTLLKTHLTHQNIQKILNLSNPFIDEMYVSKAMCILFERGPVKKSEKPGYYIILSIHEELQRCWAILKLFFQERDFYHKLRYFDITSESALERLERIDMEMNKKGLLDYDILHPNCLVGTKERPDLDEKNCGVPTIAVLCIWLKILCKNRELQMEAQVLKEDEKYKMVMIEKETSKICEEGKESIFMNSIARIKRRNLEEHRVLIETTKRYKETLQQRIEVAKLMNFVTPNGYTLLSFACAVGNNDIIRELLRRGADSMGDKYYHWSSILIQKVFRQYRLKKQLKRLKKSKRELLMCNASFVFGIGGLMRKLTHWRSFIRRPLCEAFYNGNGNVVKIFQEERASLFLASQPSRILPLGLFPFCISDDANTNNYKLPLSILDCALKGRNTFQRRTYTYGIGWNKLGVEDENDKYHQSVFVAKKLMNGFARKAEKSRREKETYREKKKSRLIMKQWIEKMECSISTGDFHSIIDCVDRGELSMEFELDGVTPLMRATMYDKKTNVDYSPVIHERTGESVSPVSYLLDRLENRPIIDFESSSGHTALSWAAFHGYVTSVSELLDRGADINKELYGSGMTPLMIARERDKHLVVSELLKRGAECRVQSR